MLTNLESIADSEYNNAGDLLGIDPLNINQELLGAIKSMNPIARQKLFNTLAKPTAASRGSRAEMEKHFKELPAHIKEELFKGSLKLTDTIIYSIKPVTSKTIKIFETQDDKQVGVRNISNGKLPKNAALLVSGIILLAGVAASPTIDDVMATNFTHIEAIPAIANGEFSLKANKKTIVGETGNYVFKTQNNHFQTLGYYKLANPRLIQDDVLIELTLELGTQTGIAANTHVYAALHGTITTP